MPNTGHYTIEDLLDIKFQSVVEFGMETISEVLERDLDAHNEIMEEMIEDLAEIDTDRRRIYGTSATNPMQKVNEHGRAPTQKQTVGDEVEFPLERFQSAVGWTGDWFRQNSPNDMAQAMLTIQKGHRQRVQTEIKRALMHSANYTMRDYLNDEVTLNVKRLVNADGAPIPDGPFGESFDGSTHSHYNAESSLTNQGLIDSIDDVVEHGHGGQIVVYINRADEQTVRGLSDFTKYEDPRLILRATDTPEERIDITQLDNRAIGIFDKAEVWVKPWIPQNYALILDVSGGNESSAERPLLYRQRENEALRGLRTVAEIDDYPLQTETMQVEFGIGVWNRTMGAVHYFNNSTYQDPSF